MPFSVEKGALVTPPNPPAHVNEAAGPNEVSVLVVEDSDVDYELVRRALQRATIDSLASFHPTRAHTLDEAIVAYSDMGPDVVVLDLALPDGSGVECIETLLVLDPEAAIVVLTGNDDKGLGLEVLRHGASDFLGKEEVSPDVLRRALLFAVERTRNRAANRRSQQDVQERRAAGQMQASLLPSTTPDVPGYDIAGAYRPADKIGGDVFDIITVDSDTLLFHVADVSGHNLVSALIMAGLRRVVRTLAPREGDLVELARAINESVHEDTTSFQFVTQFLVKLDVPGRCFDYVAAGHVGYVLRSDGTWERLYSQMPPFGIHATIPDIRPSRVELFGGDVVVLPTDGFAEATDDGGTLWGIDRMLATVAEHRSESAQRLASILMGSMIEFCRPSEPGDDCSVVILKVHED